MSCCLPALARRRATRASANTPIRAHGSDGAGAAATGQGGVTAANASQLSDGAAAVLLADMDAALADGLRPLARFKARVAIGSDPVLQLTGVIPAAERRWRAPA